MTQLDRQQSRFTKLGLQVISAVVVVVGCLVLLGWLLNIPLLKSVAPGLPTMKPNTAIGFVLIGIALRLLHNPAQTRLTYRLTQTCALTVLLIGLLTLGEYLLSWDIGIDQLVIGFTATAASPGRMPQVVAVAFVCIGAALWLLNTSRWWVAAQVLGLVALGISILSMTGYFYGVNALYGVFAFSSLALHTAITLLFISAGILLARADHGLMVVVTRDSPSGMMARRLLPAAIIIPLLLGWLWLQGEQQELYSTEFDLALFALSNILIFALLIWWNARSLHQADVQRQQIEAALHLEYERYEALVSAVSDTGIAMTIINEKAQILYANDAMCRMFGYTFDELQRLTDLSVLIAPEDLAHIQQHFAAQTQGETASGNLEIKVVRKDQQQIITELAFQRLSTPEGIRFVTIVRDLTERRWMEEHLRYQALLLDHASDAVISTDKDYIVRSFNPAAERIYGWQAHEVIGKPFNGIAQSEYRNSSREEALAELGSKGQWKGEVVQQRKDGSKILVLASVSYIISHTDEILGMVAINRDITERKQVEEELAHYRDQLELLVDERTSELNNALRRVEAILNNSVDGILLAYNDLRIQQTNGAFNRLLACEADYYFNESLLTLIHVNDIQRVAAVIKTVLAQEASAQVETLIYRKDGSIFDAEMSISCVDTHTIIGKQTNLVGSIRDITERKQAQKTLAEERNLLRTLIDTVPDFIYIKDIQHRFILSNRAHTLARGFRESDELIGKSDADFFPPNLAEQFQAEEERIFITQEPLIGHEQPSMANSGGFAWASSNKIPLRNLNGELIGLVGITRDISARVQAEQTLLRTKARLQQLIANLQGGVLLENELQRIELVNPAFCSMFQLPVPPEMLIGMETSETIEQSKYLFDDPEQFINRIHELIDGGKLALDDILYLSDGRVFERDYVPIYIDDQYVGHFWDYRDVTQTFQTRRRWEQLFKLEELNKHIVQSFLQSSDVDTALNETLALTGHLLGASRAYIFHFRENERLMDNTHEWCAPGINPELSSFQGLRFDELVPSFFPLLAEVNVIAPHHISELPEDFQAFLETRNVQAILILPIYAHDRIEGFVGYDEILGSREWLPEEITTGRVLAESYAHALERSHTQQSLVQALDAAVRTGELKSQFVSNMSHEIRTPMTGVLGMLELLRETPLDENQTEFAKTAYDSAFRLLTIINDILDFSKLEAGRVVLEAEPVDLRAIATEIKTTLVPQILNKPLSFNLYIAPDIPYRVLSDSTRIRQVLMNLAGNAVKFTVKGHVTISMKLLGEFQGIARIRFEVRDTGIGIAADQLGRIFESFVQADGTTTRKYGGTGLGLAISKQIIELLNGQIEVESIIGQGSAFSFNLALPVIEHTSANAEDTGNFANLHTLVVDDEKASRYILVQQLRACGAQVTDCDQSAEWPSLLKAQPVEMVFLRSKVPYSLSSGVIDELRLAVEQKMLRIIVHVSDTEPGLDAAHADFETHLLRPIRQSELYNLLLKASLYTQTSTPQFIEPVEPSLLGKLLLAEDYPVTIDLVKSILEPMGIQVYVASTGQELLDLLAKDTYDLILMDMHLPVIDGREATRIIREAATAYQNIPILAFTASVLKDEQEDYLQLGVNGIISKPFSINKLRETVKDWLTRSTRINDVPST